MRYGGRLARLRAVITTSAGASSASSSGYAHCSSSSIHRFRRDVSTVLFEINGKLYGSTKLLWYGSSFSSWTTSTPLKPRRISKDIRRAMVEAFVEKYKAANGGKFPNVTFTRKQVGGSHYIIREILQKLIYESKDSFIEEMKEVSPEESLPCFETKSDVEAAESPLVKAEEASTDQKNSAPRYDSSKRHSGDPEALPEDTKKPQQGGQTLLHRHISGELGQEEPLPKKPSIWSKLKSFADNIFNFWKNT